MYTALADQFTCTMSCRKSVTTIYTVDHNIIGIIVLMASDPRIKIKVQMQWPDGTYALPMPSWGCPHGWSSGWRFQDTEKHHPKNRKSWGIGRKMKVVVGKDVTLYYLSLIHI